MPEKVAEPRFRQVDLRCTCPTNQEETSIMTDLTSAFQAPAVTVVLADPDASAGTWAGWDSLDPLAVVTILEDSLKVATVDNVDQVGDLLIAASDSSYTNSNLVTDLVPRFISTFSPLDGRVSIRVLATLRKNVPIIY